MYIKNIFLVLLLLAGYSHCQRDKRFFRKDYHYLDSVKAFYKIHTIHRSWIEAKRTCELEGASLFYPENADEAQAVLSLWNETQPFHWVFIGISALLSPGVFETIDGIPVADVYNNWSPGEPNDGAGRGGEECVNMRRDGTLNDDSCGNKGPFICKKNLVSLEWNQPCGIPNVDYLFHEQVGRCYKFHLKPLSWSEAFAVCSAEQSYLAVINNPAEAEYLVSLALQASKYRVSGDYLRGAIHLGFHNKYGDGWQTIRAASTLEESGYAAWANGQPDGGDRELCGSMFYDGQLNDIGCDQKCFFICEHDIESLSSEFDDRFGDLD